MKKLIAIAATALTMGAFAADSYLYWMLGSDLTWDVTEAPTYQYAAIGVMDNATGQNVTYLNNYTYGGGTVGGNVVEAVSGASWYANLSSYASDSYSFYIELFNDKVSVGRSSTALTYAEAKTYATTFGTEVPSKDAWAPTSFTTAAIPEPTSGLLMLFGLSALALRRKRMIKA